VEFDNVLVVENLLTKLLKAAHATHLRFYRDKELHVTAELSQAAKHNDHQLYVVSKMLDATYNEQETFHELLAAWRGFPVAWRGLPVGEANWEPYSIIAMDVPEMAEKFMESHDDKNMVYEKQSRLEFS
jgi:hypothetical protein